MSPEAVTDVVREALYIALQTSGPLLLIAMVVGLVIALFQSVTQISEITLTFVPKILIVAGALGVLFPWILKTLSRYAYSIIVFQWENVLK